MAIAQANARTAGFTGQGAVQARGPRVTRNSAQDDRPAAMVWVNTGYYVEAKNPETGEKERVFISLPMGIPLDTSEPVATNSRNRFWSMQQMARNALQQKLLALSETMEPGTEIDLAEHIPELTIQMRRAGDAVEVADDENPFIL